jgi:AcrR family transcriptional regulator
MADELVRQKRRPHRRDQILAAAVTMFHEHGYHATGMDEIGAAAGITGPGVYRHFSSKEEILETLVRNRGEAVLAEAERIAASELPPPEALDALARSYVAGIAADPSLAVVAMYERHILGAATRKWIDRMERRNVEQWVTVVRNVRTDLTEAEARVLVHAALSLGVAVCNYESGLDASSLAALMHPMVMTAILGTAPVPSRA